MLLTNSSSFYRLDELFVQLVWRARLQQLAARPDQCAEVRRITWQSPRQQRYRYRRGGRRRYVSWRNRVVDAGHR